MSNSDKRITASQNEDENAGGLIHVQANESSFELSFPSAVYDDFIANYPISISPRDKLSFIDDKKQWKETNRFLSNNSNLNKLTRILQTEIVRCKPENILNFINDEFFSLENQTRLRTILKD